MEVFQVEDVSWRVLMAEGPGRAVDFHAVPDRALWKRPDHIGRGVLSQKQGAVS